MWNQASQQRQPHEIKIQKNNCQSQQWKQNEKHKKESKSKAKKQKKVKIIKKEKDCDYVLSAASLYQVRETWTQRQDLIFLDFIKDNEPLFNTENLRRSGKVFLRLSRMMGQLRTPNHCKSHYQKLQKESKEGNIKSVINYLEQKYGISNSTIGQQLKCQKKSDATIKIDNGLQYGENVQMLVYNSKKALQMKIFVKIDGIASW